MSNKAEIRMIALKFPERINAIREAEQLFEKTYGRYSSFFPRKAVPPRFWSKPYTNFKGEQKMEDILEPTGEVNEEGYPVMKKVGEKPMLVATIDDIVRWAMTGDRAKGSYLDNEPVKEHKCQSGFCE